MNLKVKIGKASFKNPVTVASGTFGHAEKYYSQDEVKSLGAIVPKTVTCYAQRGNPPVRIVETPSGMLNAIGIENPGPDEFIAKKLPALLKTGVPVIISVLGYDDDQFVEVVRKFDGIKGVAAIELNLSCPNLKHKNLIAQDPGATGRLVGKIKKITQAPLIAKLSPNVTDITVIAKAAEDAGADAVSLINTFTGMVIDIEKRKSMLGNFTGGLSGPAIRPLAVHMVHRVYKTVKVPIVAMGGIMNARDAIEFIIAGAAMVAVGTANFINPRTPIDVLEGIKDYLKRHHISDIDKLRGSLITP